MTNEQRELLKYWQLNLQLFLRGHYAASVGCERKNLLLGAPTFILSAIVGTSVFSTLATEPTTEAKIAVGLTSMLVTVLAALQTFLRYSERGEKHRISGATFAALHKEIGQLLVVSPIDEQKLGDAITSIRHRWDELSKESPTIPEKIWDRITTEQVPEKSMVQDNGRAEKV
jgi:hypothetical protein